MNAFGRLDPGIEFGELAGMRPCQILHNLLPAALVTAALERSEARLSAGGALVATTGRITGRSPQDKFIVANAAIRAIRMG